jgi:RNA polymerase sigma-B factor
MTLTIERDPLLAVDTMFVRMAELGPDHPQREQMRADIVHRCTPFARREAARYRNTGEPLEDLNQVALLGLIMAVDRFDHTRGVPFKHFALPTIIGELKRHFRDKGWSMRVSRRLKEISHEVRRAEQALAQQLARTPSTQDLAEALDLTEEEVLSARDAEGAHFVQSLNRPVFGPDDTTELVDTLGSDDRSIAAVADHDALRRALRALSPRLATVVSLRFLDELTQTEIGDKIGCSQMQVSRLLDRAMTVLRGHMTADLIR